MEPKTVEIDGKTYIETQDGKPVYIDEGKEMAMDVPGMRTKIVALGKDEKGHREAAQAAEEKLKAYEGIDDPEAARKALETVSALDQKDLVEAGKVDEIKAAAIKATEEKMAAAIKAKDNDIAERDKKIEGLSGTLNKELIGGNFSRSKFIEENVAVPVDFVEAKFGQHFLVEDGQIVATDASGNKIYSRAKPGELAGFDEALEYLIDSYENKDHILKGRQQRGSGSEGGNGGKGGGKTMKRADFDSVSKSDPARAQKIISEGVEIVD